MGYQYGYIKTVLPGTGKIWLDDVVCYSTSMSRLSDCTHKPWGKHDCNHDKDVSVECLSKTSSIKELCLNVISREMSQSMENHFEMILFDEKVNISSDLNISHFSVNGCTLIFTMGLFQCGKELVLPCCLTAGVIKLNVSKLANFQGFLMDFHNSSTC